MRPRLAAAVLAALAAGPAVAAAAPLAPNLGMAPLADIRVERSPAGRDQLRFSGIVVNRGAGPFELRSVRAGLRARWTVQQRVYDSQGPPALLPTAARMTFGGDGHGHWHVRDLALYELVGRDGDAVVGRRRKQGFCFFDTEKAGGAAGPVPRDERYRAASCGGRRSRGLTTGLSAGWADRYHWTLPDQFIDVTGLPAGVYRLRATADHPGLFAESDEHDNVAWSDVRITRRGGVARARVVARGGGRP